MVTLLEFSEKNSEWPRLDKVPASDEDRERKGTVMFCFMCPLDQIIILSYSIKH